MVNEWMDMREKCHINIFNLLTFYLRLIALPVGVWGLFPNRVATLERKETHAQLH